MKRILFNIFFIILLSSCHPDSDEYTYNYYKMFNKYINAGLEFTIRKDSKEYYKNNLFKPEIIEKVKYKIQELCKIPYDTKKGIIKHSYSYTMADPYAIMNFLFYIDEKENLYFTDQYSVGEGDDYSERYYKYFDKKGNFIKRNNYKYLYEMLEKGIATKPFLYGIHGLPMPKQKWGYFDGNNSITTERIVDDIIFTIKNDKNITSYKYPGGWSIGKEVLVENDIVYCLDNEYFDSWSLPDPSYGNKFISIYNFKKQEYVSRNILIGTGYYEYCGADSNARFYLFRSTAVHPYVDEKWKKMYTPHFRTGEIQIYDLEKKTITILEHPFPEAKGEKPMWAFYVVQKDGTIYCDYILNDGHHVAKIEPDWNSLEPYPEYTPTVFVEDWKNKE